MRIFFFDSYTHLGQRFVKTIFSDGASLSEAIAGGLEGALSEDSFRAAGSAKAGAGGETKARIESSLDRMRVKHSRGGASPSVSSRAAAVCMLSAAQRAAFRRFFSRCLACRVALACLISFLFMVIFGMIFVARCVARCVVSCNLFRVTFRVT